MVMSETAARYGRKREPRRGRTNWAGWRNAETSFAYQLSQEAIAYEREFKFHPKRRWQADFYLGLNGVLVEIEGGAWIRGRHTRGVGFQADIEKYNEAQLAGYRVIRGTPADVNSSRLLTWVKRAITP